MPGIIDGKLPKWNPDDEKVLEPWEDKKNTGWLAGEYPPYNWWNWLLKQTSDSLEKLNDNSFLNTAEINEIMADDFENRPDAANQKEKDIFIAVDQREIYQIINEDWQLIGTSKDTIDGGKW